MAHVRRSSPITAAGPRWIRTTFPFCFANAAKHPQSQRIHLSKSLTAATAQTFYYSLWECQAHAGSRIHTGVHRNIFVRFISRLQIIIHL